MPWCAINPWNGFLYSSKFGEPPRWEEDPSGTGLGRLVDWDPVTEVHCYDPADNFTHKRSLPIMGEPLHKLQGGCFSTNGHLYLTSDHTQQIRAYSALNGAFLGDKWVDYDKSGLTYTQEIEGICILPLDTQKETRMYTLWFLRTRRQAVTIFSSNTILCLTRMYYKNTRIFNI